MIRQLLEILRTPVCRRQYGVFQDIPSPRGTRLPAEWLKEEFPELAEKELPPIVDFLAVEHGKFWKPTVALSVWWLLLSNNQSNQDQLAVTPITARELFLTCLVQKSLRRNSHPSRRVMLMLELASLFAGFVGFALLEIHHKDDAIYYHFLLFLALFALFLPMHYAIGGWSAMGCCEDIASALRYYENMHHVKTGKGRVKLRWFLRIDREGFLRNVACLSWSLPIAVILGLNVLGIFRVLAEFEHGKRLVPFAAVTASMWIFATPWGRAYLEKLLRYDLRSRFNEFKKRMEAVRSLENAFGSTHH